MIYLNIFLTTVIVCYIVDISGVMTSFKNFLRRWLNINSNISIKPFDCSLCMSHWINLCGILYILLNNVINITDFLCYYTFVLFCSCNTIFITSALNLISDILNYITNKLYKLIDE